MVRTYKEKTNRTFPSPDIMMAAARVVKIRSPSVSIRKAAQEFNVHCKYLERFSKIVTYGTSQISVS